MQHILLYYLVTLSFCAKVIGMTNDLTNTVKVYGNPEQKGIKFKYSHPESFEFIKKILSSGMKEAKEKKIKFSEFNQSELKIFVRLLNILDKPNPTETIEEIKNECCSIKDFNDYFVKFYHFAEHREIKPLFFGLTNYFISLLQKFNIENATELIDSCPLELKEIIYNLISMVNSKQHLHNPQALLNDPLFIECLQLPVIQNIIYSDFFNQEPIIPTKQLTIDSTTTPHNLFFQNNRIITFQEKDILRYDSLIGKKLQSIKTKKCIRSMAMNHDFFATGGTKEQIKLFSKNGDFLNNFAAKSSFNTISSLTFSKSEPLLAAGTQKGSLQIHQISDLKIKLKKQILSQPNILSMAFSSNKLYVGTSRELLELNLPTGKIEAIPELIALNGPIYAVNIYNDQTLIGSFGKQIAVMDLRTDCCVMQLQGHQSTIISMDQDMSNHTLFSGSKDGTVRVWDIRNNQNLYTFKTPNGALTYDPSTRTLFTINNNKLICRSFNKMKSCKTLLEERALQIKK